MEEGIMFAKVMSDEQVEILRKQIAVYATISQQLAHLHKSLTTAQNHHHLSAGGVMVGNLYCDSFLASGAHRIAGRQRWSPTPLQLQILERIFDEGTGTPNKAKIKEIATELSQHGQISETNVYNWFQNRRARSKRKQQAAPGTNDVESETETTIVSPNNTKTKEDFQSQHIPRSEDPSTGEPEPVLPLEGSSKLVGTSFEQMPFYGTVLPNPTTL